MKNLHVTSSEKTPEVLFNAESGTMLLKGRAIQDDPIEFFQTLYDWVEIYCNQPSKETIFEVKLQYINTSSSKCLLHLFKKLERLCNSTSQVVQIHWHFEENNENMLEAGEDFQAIINLPFKMIGINESNS